MSRGVSIRKARKGECAPCLVMSDTGSGIHSERQREWRTSIHGLRLCMNCVLRGGCHGGRLRRSAPFKGLRPLRRWSGYPLDTAMQVFPCWSCEA